MFWRKQEYPDANGNTIYRWVATASTYNMYPLTGSCKKCGTLLPISQLSSGICMWCEDTRQIMVDGICPDCGTKYQDVSLFTSSYYGCPKCGREASK